MSDEQFPAKAMDHERIASAARLVAFQMDALRWHDQQREREHAVVQARLQAHMDRAFSKALAIVHRMNMDI